MKKKHTDGVRIVPYTEEFFTRLSPFVLVVLRSVLLRNPHLCRDLDYVRKGSGGGTAVVTGGGRENTMNSSQQEHQTRNTINFVALPAQRDSQDDSGCGGTCKAPEIVLLC